jgi:hypothetical protein
MSHAPDLLVPDADRARIVEELRRHYEMLPPSSR